MTMPTDPRPTLTPAATRLERTLASRPAALAAELAEGLRQSATFTA
ncbi:hypothetical protein [Streptomyces kronopolitis]